MEKEVPIGVKVISILFYIIGILGVLGFVGFWLTLLIHSYALGFSLNEVSNWGMMSFDLLILVLYSFFGFYLGKGLKKGNYSARNYSIVFFGVMILLTILTIFTEGFYTIYMPISHIDTGFSALFGIIKMGGPNSNFFDLVLTPLLSIIFGLYLIYNKKANEFFKKM